MSLDIRKRRRSTWQTGPFTAAAICTIGLLVAGCSRDCEYNEFGQAEICNEPPPSIDEEMLGQLFLFGLALVFAGLLYRKFCKLQFVRRHGLQPLVANLERQGWRVRVWSISIWETRKFSISATCKKHSIKDESWPLHLEGFNNAYIGSEMSGEWSPSAQEPECGLCKAGFPPSPKPRESDLGKLG